MEVDNTQYNVLLVCTVGGTREPVVASLKHWRPKRVLFVHTPQTRSHVEDKESGIVSIARKEGIDLGEGSYELFELPDGQDLESCLERLRQLTPEVLKWAERGGEYRVVVDFTGGTKCMSAAIALQAHRWPCVFSYVGGEERTKEGVGVVVSGKEVVLHRANPWNELGYQSVEDFVVLFDQYAFRAAATVARRAKERVSSASGKREFAVLEKLAEAFEHWERFDHRKSVECLKDVQKGKNDLVAVFGPSKGTKIYDAVEKHCRYLEKVANTKPPSRDHVKDLLANARRRKNEGRLDDAVARLYRAIEAIAQVALKERHGIESTEKIPFERIPETLRQEWAPRVRDDVIALGVQDVYRLLGALNDPLWEKFCKQGLQGRESALSARNRSILAHGFERISEKDFEPLWSAARALADIHDNDLPEFPVLGELGS